MSVLLTVVNIRREMLPFLLFGSVLFIVSVANIPGGDCLLKLPEFAEPLKNVTLSTGSDVEFSCDVRYLGTYRVAWSWKRDKEQKFLGIGVIKISQNPRVHISRVQRSDDITQFNLYIYNIKKEDSGTYHCSVNSNPMIEQIGTLDVFSNGNGENYDIEDKSLTTDQLENKEIDSSATEIMNLTNSSTTTFAPVNESDSGEVENIEYNNGNVSTNSFSNSSSFSNMFGNSTMLCIDLNDIWESTRERISDFLSTLAKFSYSYWFS